ncbi:unnamed protein product, partial [Iphiclides podalirius]
MVKPSLLLPSSSRRRLKKEKRRRWLSGTKTGCGLSVTISLKSLQDTLPEDFKILIVIRGIPNEIEVDEILVDIPYQAECERRKKNMGDAGSKKKTIV